MKLTRRQRVGYAAVIATLRADITASVVPSSLPPPVAFLSKIIAVCNGDRLDLTDRLTRARVALYLRAVLRADVGDYGQCIDCDCDVCWRTLPAPVIRPLWEQAPPTR
jgi:hypothetical protein